MTDQATDTGRPAACRMCHRLLNQPDDPTSADCGGDCMRCLAQAGDPDCIAAVAKINRVATVQMIPTEGDAYAMHAPAISPYRIRYGQGHLELLTMQAELDALDRNLAMVRRCMEDCALGSAAGFLGRAIECQANAIAWASR